MARRQEKIWNNALANEFNGKHGNIGIGLCFKAIQTFGNTPKAHEFCDWLFNLRKNNKSSQTKFEDLVMQFNISKTL